MKQRCILVFMLGFGIALPTAAADFTITITDSDSLAGIAWAREQHNATLPKDPQGQPVGVLKTDATYIAHIAQRAAESYGRQKAVSVLDVIKAKCLDAGDCTNAWAVGAAEAK